MPETRPPSFDLAACEREPIHIPGSIQPHGILLTIDGEGRVAAASDNADDLWGPVIGRPVIDLIDDSVLSAAPEPQAPTARYAGMLEQSSSAFDVFVHRTQQGFIVELERASQPRLSASEVLEQMVTSSSRIGEARDLSTATQAAAEAVRDVTGYDRVMVYRFLDDGSGEVIAEARVRDIDPLLNHRYPASDIPRQARELYLKNPIRVIQDVGYTPVPLRAERAPIDLGGALLRSVSPVHIQYLKNMGIGASASVSIVYQGELWGLIACHHRSAKAIGYERRETSRQVTLALEVAIHRLEEEQSQREALRLTRRREELLPQIAAAASLHEGLARNVEELLQTIPAHGLALVCDDEITTVGVTPPDEAIEQLTEWLVRQSAPTVHTTDNLGQDFAPAQDWTAQASGLLSLIVSRKPASVVMWFRAEEVETVNWAGNPHEPLDTSAPAGALCPRRSFELWVEQVRGRSRPWRTNEQDAARRLAERLEEIDRLKALARMNRYLGESLDAKESALAEKDLLMREVHHRVQNNLQLVTSMLRLQEREIDDPSARRQLELARDRVKSISVLHRRLWRSDDLQLVNIDSFLCELVDDLANAWGAEWRDHISIEAAPIRVTAERALLLGVIVTELLTNAFKHAYNGATGPVAVRAADQGKAGVVVTVADNGVGTDGAARPGSFGSQLVQRLVQQVSGEFAFDSNQPGTIVTLTLPAVPAVSRLS